jgi:fatty acid desaturase
MATASSPLYRDCSDPEIVRQVAALRQPDNLTNWFYLVREYLLLAAVISPTIALWVHLPGWGLSWAWAVPVAVVAILCVGAGQHRLATLTHEAAHYVLFRNRLLNELVSEWFCMLPMLGTTHSYRVQHLGHHQYPNDPERDPDWTQLRRSGHRYQFPMSRGAFLWHCFFKQLLWLPGLIHYVLVRARFVVDQKGNTPYRMKRYAHPALKAFGLLYRIALIGVLTALVWQEDLAAVVWLPALFLVVGLAVFTLVPAAWFAESAIKCDVGPRWLACIRVTFFTLLVTSLAALTLTTGQPCWLFYCVLWLVPLGTSFALFMILRQLVQHGNADRDRFTNTRIFLVNPLLSMAVFPLGQDYHLPHHLFPMVPHYNLRKLHALLLQTEPYRQQARVVQGYFLPAERPPQYPTVVDIMTK